MARSKSSSAKLTRGTGAFRRFTLRALLGATFLGSVGYGFYALRDYVEHRHASPQQQLGIIIKDRPVWMSHELALQIANEIRPAGLHSAMDHQVLRDVTDGLRHNPWVRSVRQVR